MMNGCYFMKNYWWFNVRQGWLRRIYLYRIHHIYNQYVYVYIHDICTNTVCPILFFYAVFCCRYIVSSLRFTSCINLYYSRLIRWHGVDSPTHSLAHAICIPCWCNVIRSFRQRFSQHNWSTFCRWIYQHYFVCTQGSLDGLNLVQDIYIILANRWLVSTYWCVHNLDPSKTNGIDRQPEMVSVSISYQ